jgi:hypothetical protein
VNAGIKRKIAQRERRILRRLDKTDNRGCSRPVMTASNIHYQIADRTRATPAGGIGAIHLLVRKLGLDEAINRRLPLLKIHLPYHESDHVLNIAYNLLAGAASRTPSSTRPSSTATARRSRPPASASRAWTSTTLTVY